MEFRQGATTYQALKGAITGDVNLALGSAPSLISPYLRRMATPLICLGRVLSDPLSKYPPF